MHQKKIRKSSEMPSLTCISVLEQVSYNMVLSVVNKLWLSTSQARTDEYLNLTMQTVKSYCTCTHFSLLHIYIYTR